MKVNVDINRQDYADFCFFVFRKTRLLQTIVYGLAIFFILLFFINRDKHSLSLTNILMALFFFSAIYSFQIYFRLSNSKNYPLENGAFLGRREYDFSEDFISFTSKNSEGKMQWDAIKSIGIGKKAYYLYMDRNMAIVIPKRCFLDKEEVTNFAGFVQKKISSSQ